MLGQDKTDRRGGIQGHLPIDPGECLARWRELPFSVGARLRFDPEDAICPPAKGRNHDESASTKTKAETQV